MTFSVVTLTVDVHVRNRTASLSLSLSLSHSRTLFFNKLGGEEREKRATGYIHEGESRKRIKCRIPGGRRGAAAAPTKGERERIMVWKRVEGGRRKEGRRG